MRKEEQALIKLFSHIDNKSRLFISPCKGVNDLLYIIEREVGTIASPKISKAFLNIVESKIKDMVIERDYKELASINHNGVQIEVHLCKSLDK